MQGVGLRVYCSGQGVGFTVHGLGQGAGCRVEGLQGSALYLALLDAMHLRPSIVYADTKHCVFEKSNVLGLHECVYLEG